MVSKERLALSFADAQLILVNVFALFHRRHSRRKITAPLVYNATLPLTSTTGHKFISAQLAVLTDVTTARKQDIQGPIDKAQSGG